MSCYAFKIKYKIESKNNKDQQVTEMHLPILLNDYTFSELYIKKIIIKK